MTPRHRTNEHDRGSAVNHGADRKCADHSDRHVELGSLALLGGRRRRVETDIAEEDVRADRDDAVRLRRRRIIGEPTKWLEFSPTDRVEVVQIRGVKEEQAGDNEDDERRDLQHDEDVVHGRGLADSDGEQDAQANDEDRRDEIVLRVREVPARRQPPRTVNDQIRLLGPSRQYPTGVLEDVLNSGRKLLSDRRGADAVLEDECKADDPSKEFSHRRVGVGVGASGDRDHRTEFRVAERRKKRRQPGQQIRDDDGRTGAFDAGPDGGKDSAADHRTEADGDQVLRGQRSPKDLALTEFAQLLGVRRREELGEERHSGVASH